MVDKNEKTLKLEKTDYTICPLMTASHNRGVVKCSQEQCEWWCGWTETCAITTIAGHIADLRR